MERKKQRVKARRRYDSTGRRAHAERARSDVLDAAERLLLAEGYAATTIASIASAAGVSVETIYKGFGGKPGLVRAIRERRLAGTGVIHAETRSDRMRARETDPRRLVAQWGKLTVEVAPLVSPILLLVREAATSDDEMAELLEEVDADRLRRMTVNARHLRDGGHLRAGVSLAAAADALWMYTSPELYELFVLRRRWSIERYGRFVADAVAAALL
jgi:AcrR family transcriptional regulator